jgi:hypothetical protein
MALIKLTPPPYPSNRPPPPYSFTPPVSSGVLSQGPTPTYSASARSKLEEKEG